MKNNILRKFRKPDLARSQANRLFFLEFIRNLTPQSVILAVTLVMTRRLDFSIDFSNTIPTLFSAALILIWGYSAYANISLFLERTLENREKARATRLLKQMSIRKGQLIWLQTKYLFRYQKSYVIRTYVMLGVAQFGFTASIIYAVPAADSLLRITSH